MNKNIAIFTLTSELHDEKSVSMVTREFLTSLGIEYELKGNDYTNYGVACLNLIYVSWLRQWRFFHICASTTSKARLFMAVLNT